MPKHTKLETGSTKEVVKRNMRKLVAKGMLLGRARGVAVQAAALTKVKKAKKGPIAQALRGL